MDLRTIIRHPVLPACLALTAIAGIVLAAVHFALFSTNYLPHRYCYRAQPGLIWTNVVMDGLIAVSYAVIFGCLFWMVYKIRPLYALRRYIWVLVSFGLFIAACGATHAMELVTVWWPYYPLAASVKVLCALASVPTAILLLRMVPTLFRSICQFLEMLSTTTAQRDAAELALLSTKDSLNLALMAANGIGLWDWDIPNNLLYADLTIARFYGVDPEWAAAGAPLVEYTRNIPAEDAVLVTEAMSAAIATRGPYLLDYRINRSDGAPCWVNARGGCTFAADGSPLRFSGVSVEITERKLGEETLRHTEALKRKAVEALAAAERLAEEARVAAAAVLA